MGALDETENLANSSRPMLMGSDAPGVGGSGERPLLGRGDTYCDCSGPDGEGVMSELLGDGMLGLYIERTLDLAPPEGGVFSEVLDASGCDDIDGAWMGGGRISEKMII
ncbi:hypothetical protein [Corallococcus sp. AS-1-6]|uniref:hypothetical protein n=1 Tax=Corallococcus sp. AS-1-6 TaxID=2874599 RepID=UPI001CBB3496|nr:hypothetical protein [Corallococcus sp. AS-1-6]MBZ4371015.1 hypothetical protein [Corallococcus sp. AS-1-6]